MLGRRAKGARAQSLDLSDLLMARSGDGSVVLHVPSGTYLRLDGTATEILDLVQAQGRSGAAVALAHRHRLEAELASADVDSVLDRIREARASGDRPMRRPGLRGGVTVVRQWGRLPRPAKVAVTKTTAIVLAVEVALRLLPITSIARRAGAPLVQGQGRSSLESSELDLTRLSDQEVTLMAAADWTLARWVFDATCLRRALLFGWILRRRRPELRIGLMEGGDVQAHAWLIVEGGTLGALGDVGEFSRLGSSPPLNAIDGR